MWRSMAILAAVLFAAAPVAANACTGTNSKTKQRESVQQIYRSSSHPKRYFAEATHDPRTGRPQIIYYARYNSAPSYFKSFIRAHECCHHSLGHIAKFKQGLGQLGPQPFFYIAPALRQMELEADCCAVRLLRDRHEEDGIAAARTVMSVFGKEQTGAYYPTGDERVQNIEGCAGPAE